MSAINTPFVIGHRGAAALAPENTLEGIAQAATEGARWIEFDVKLSADGVPILMHDDTLMRTTNGQGNVAERDSATLRALDAGSWFGPAFSGARIPTLSETIAYMAELELGANVELKPCPGREVETARVVCDLLRRTWPQDLPPPVMSSFSTLAVAESSRQVPEYEHAMLVTKLPRDWLVRAEALRATAVHMRDRDTREKDVEAVREHGWPLRVYTVNDPVRAAELRAWGVTSVFTDRPDLIKD